MCLGGLGEIAGTYLGHFCCASGAIFGSGYTMIGVSDGGKGNMQIMKNYLKHTQSSFLIMLVSNSTRFSWSPGSEPILMDLEKLLLLPEPMQN